MATPKDSRDDLSKSDPARAGDAEREDRSHDDSPKLAEAAQEQEPTDDASSDRPLEQPQKIDREFIRRVIAPELELYWSRKYGRTQEQ